MFFKKWFKKKEDEVITSVMTPEQEETARNWLKEKWPKSKRSCKVCGVRHHVLAKDIVAPNRFVKNSFVFGGECYPSFMVICANCGEIKFFNAVKAGILKSNIRSVKRQEIY